MSNMPRSIEQTFVGKRQSADRGGSNRSHELKRAADNKALRGQGPDLPKIANRIARETESDRELVIDAQEIAEKLLEDHRQRNLTPEITRQMLVSFGYNPEEVATALRTAQQLSQPQQEKETGRAFHFFGRKVERLGRMTAILVLVFMMFSFASPAILAQGETVQPQTVSARIGEGREDSGDNGDPTTDSIPPTTTAPNNTDNGKQTPSISTSKEVTQTQETINAGATLTVTHAFTATKFGFSDSTPITISAGSKITETTGVLTSAESITLTFSLRGERLKAIIPIELAQSFTSTQEITATIDTKAIEIAKPVRLVSAKQNNTNMRSGPDTSYSKVGTFGPNDAFEIVGENRDSTWFEVERDDGTRAWVASWVVYIKVIEEKTPVGGAGLHREIITFLADKLGLPEEKINLVFPKPTQNASEQDDNPNDTKPVAAVDDEGNVLGHFEIKVFGTKWAITFKKWWQPTISRVVSESDQPNKQPVAKNTPVATSTPRGEAHATPTPEPTATATPRPTPTEVKVRQVEQVVPAEVLEGRIIKDISVFPNVRIVTKSNGQKTAIQNTLGKDVAVAVWDTEIRSWRESTLSDKEIKEIIDQNPITMLPIDRDGKGVSPQLLTPSAFDVSPGFEIVEKGGDRTLIMYGIGFNDLVVRNLPILNTETGMPTGWSLRSLILPLATLSNSKDVQRTDVVLMTAISDPENDVHWSEMARKNFTEDMVSMSILKNNFERKSVGAQAVEATVATEKVGVKGQSLVTNIYYAVRPESANRRIKDALRSVGLGNIDFLQTKYSFELTNRQVELLSLALRNGTFSDFALDGYARLTEADLHSLLEQNWQDNQTFGGITVVYKIEP